MTDRLAQDPDELFDVIDMTGAPTGVRKRRADIHRDGDWHRAIHVWIHGQDDDGAFLLLQHRGHDKDSWPGRLDATAAGHLAAGETPEDAFREIEEELGIVPDPAQLVHVGTRVIAGEEPPDRLDREMEEVYLLRDDRPLGDYRPDPVEVDALVRVPLAAWLAFLFGEEESAEGLVMPAVGRAIRTLTITRDHLVPAPDRYFARVAVACHRARAGERYIVV
jgi:isopentenyldiphosphate isomerase